MGKKAEIKSGQINEKSGIPLKNGDFTGLYIQTASSRLSHARKIWTIQASLVPNRFFIFSSNNKYKIHCMYAIFAFFPGYLKKNYDLSRIRDK